MSTITPTHVNYYHICRRKLWLFANGINMEHSSELVAEGKFIGETSYPQRAEKYTELEIEGAKIDFYDAKNKVVHEVEKIRQSGRSAYRPSQVLSVSAQENGHRRCRRRN